MNCRFSVWREQGEGFGTFAHRISTTFEQASHPLDPEHPAWDHFTFADFSIHTMI
jgi:hypothetical protein